MAAKKKGSPRKKAVSKKQTGRWKKQKSVIFKELKKILVGIAVLLAVCLTVAMIADIFFKPGSREKEKKVAPKPVVQQKIKPVQEDIYEPKNIKKITGLKDKSDKKNKSGRTGQPLKYEIFDDVDQTIVKKPVTAVKGHVPRIAIIIDDIGYDKKITLAISELNPEITFSVLPFSPFGKVLSEKLHKKGLQLMLHLPMEPIEYPDIDPGPGAILLNMTPDDLLEQLRKNIDDVSYIAGVNNHMGSKLTAQSDQMNQIFTILKKENLFFIDSRTSAESKSRASARLLQLKFAQRDVFLDNIQDTGYITGQLKELIHLAKQHGTAIGIGHPYKATLETLEKELPKLSNQIRIVRAGDLASIVE